MYVCRMPLAGARKGVNLEAEVSAEAKSGVEEEEALESITSESILQ